MGHGIFMNKAAFRKQPGWHGIGPVWTGEELNATEAGKRAGVFFPVEKRPLYVEVDEDTKILVPEQYAITRMPTVEVPTSKVFGYVGNKYHVIQNETIAQILDPLTERYPVESCAALHEGQVLFMCLRDTRGSEVGGDEIVNYFVLEDNKDGKHNVRMLYTPVRVVCQNTLTAAANAASINLEIPHSRHAEADLKFYSNLVLEIQAAQDRTLGIFRKMTQARINEDSIAHVFGAAFPEPAKPKVMQRAEHHNVDLLAEQKVEGAREQMVRVKDAKRAWESKAERAQSIRKLAQEALVKFNDEHTRHANTCWALYNACTEVSDWRRSSGRGAKENVKVSILFGDRAVEKERAYTATVEVMEGAH
jgi:phage/plasmid-like protein (TIGR03299 family)